MPSSRAWTCTLILRSASLICWRSGWRAVARCACAPIVGAQLAGELLQAHRTEDSLGKELFHEGQEGVFAQVDPLLARMDFGGGGVGAVRGSVGAGV